MDISETKSSRFFQLFFSLKLSNSAGLKTPFIPRKVLLGALPTDSSFTNIRNVVIITNIGGINKENYLRQKHYNYHHQAINLSRYINCEYIRHAGFRFDFNSFHKVQNTVTWCKLTSLVTFNWFILKSRLSYPNYFSCV